MGDTVTVRELIEALSKLPQDLPIYLADWSERYADDFELKEQPEVKRRDLGSTALPERVVLG